MRFGGRLSTARGPKSMVSVEASFQASGKDLAAVTFPTPMSSFRKASYGAISQGYFTPRVVVYVAHLC